MADEDYAIPIFLINGQLESGKTTFISDTIEMGQFDEAQKKLLIVCEEGEEEYVEPTDEEFALVQKAYDALMDEEDAEG